MQAVAGIRRELTIDPAGEEEAPAERVGQLVRESPVVVFARRGCYMAHVMKRLLAAVGAHVTVIELEGSAEEMELAGSAAAGAAGASLPALLVGGDPVGALEGLMGSTSAAALSHASERSAPSAPSPPRVHARFPRASSEASSSSSSAVWLAPCT